MILSVIIPVFNLEQCIEQCVNSILNQPIKEGLIEIIIINDGSTDNSINVINQLASENSNIIVIDKINTGVSDSRNIGIHNAKGKYITFVDGDDSIYKDSLLKILNSLINSPEILFSNSIRNKIVRYCVPKRMLNSQESFFSGRDLFNMKYMRGSVCGCVFLKSFLLDNKLLFNVNLDYGEDTLFMCLASTTAKKTIYRNIDFYSIYERENSASRQWDTNKFKKYIEQIKVIFKTRDSYVGIQKYAFDYYLYMSNHILIRNLIAFKEQDIETIIRQMNILPLKLNKLAYWKMLLLNTSLKSFIYLMKIKNR